MADPKDLYNPKALEGNEGMTEMVVFPHNGKIIQRFARPMLFVAYDPKNVGELMNLFLSAAKEGGNEVVINLPRRKISKTRRDALVTRAFHVHRSMTEQKRPPMDIARHVVDSILSEIE